MHTALLIFAFIYWDGGIYVPVWVWCSDYQSHKCHHWVSHCLQLLQTVVYFPIHPELFFFSILVFAGLYSFIVLQASGFCSSHFKRARPHLCFLHALHMVWDWISHTQKHKTCSKSAQAAAEHVQVDAADRVSGWRLLSPLPLSAVQCLEMTTKRKLIGRLVPCRCFRGEEEVISVLDYSHCSLQQVPKEIFSFERTLEELYLDANQIEELPKVTHCSSTVPQQTAFGRGGNPCLPHDAIR